MRDLLFGDVTRVLARNLTGQFLCGHLICPARCLTGLPVLCLAILMSLAGLTKVARAEPVTCETPVSTSQGAISGLAGEDGLTCSWRGVPYALPPIGARRWKAPEPTAAWEGVRAAEKFAPRCMQRGPIDLINDDPSGKRSEDCLYLNIWRPRAPGKYPVYVWFHGGGLIAGTANTPVYWGDVLSARGKLVVVGVNYRLNIFGFLANEALAEEDPNGSTGNYGLLDQLEALRWVRDNIAAFGGDPENITIAGESAGGWSVCNLLTSPLGEGLFHRAIIESGGCHSVKTLERGFDVGRIVAEELNCDPRDLKCMREASTRTVARVGLPNIPHVGWWLPHIDGYALTDYPYEVMARGEYHRVPILAGATRDEAGLFMMFTPCKRRDKERKYSKRLEEMFGELSGDLQSIYRVDSFESPYLACRQALTDVSLSCPTYNGLKAASGYQPATWLYRFDFDDTRMGRRMGSPHGLDLPYAFGTWDRPPFKHLYRGSQREAAQKVSDVVLRYWAQFAHTGDPNAEGLPPWPRYGESGQLQVLDEEVRTETVSEDVSNRCAFWLERIRDDPVQMETFGGMMDE